MTTPRNRNILEQLIAWFQSTGSAPHDRRTSIRRTVRVADVKVHLPSDTDSQMDTVICRFVQQLAAGTRYSALELPDQIYQLQEALWSAMLSFILYKMKIVNHGAEQSTEVPVEAYSVTGAPSVTPRLLYVCDGVYSVKATISLLHRLKRKLGLPELDCIRITAVGDPADVCSYSKNFRKMHKTQSEKNAACRMKVQLGQYKPYENTFDDSVQKSTIPDFLPELDEVLRLLSTAKCCPYYSLLYRMSSSHLIVTTYGALKETLNGSRPVGERLPLDESTFLLCDDMFALERTFDCCYDFTLSTFDLRHAITFGHERAVFVKQTYDVVFAENKPERNEAENALRDIVQFLERLYWILEEGSSPDLGKILGILGLSHLSPTSSHRIITSFIADATLPSFQSKLRPSVLKAWLQIQQLFLNLMNLDVVRWTLSKDKDVPFRFWFDNDTFANQKPNLKTYKFFGVSSSPALQALKSMRVPCLVTIGVMVPVSFSVLPADILTIYPATLLEKQNAIQTANLHSALLYAGPDKVRLSFIAAAKNDSRNILTIGQVLHNILEVLRGNVLVLFPSASFYETCLLTWSMHKKLCTLNEFFTFIKCCSPGCVECNQEVSLQEQEGKIVVSTVRCALPDAIAGGFHAVVNVSLAYTNFKSGFNVAKEAHLKNHSKRAAWNFYTQEAINAMVSPLIKSSCLDPMAALRGRILINLDDRLIKLQDEIPLFLLKRTVATDLFDDGMNRLKSFLNNVPGWDLTTISGPGILERAKLHLLRIFDSCWFKEDLHSAIVKRVSELLEQFDTDGNIDLLAAGILDAIQIKDLLLRSDLHSVVLSWVFSFRGFFQSDAHQEYWPLVISGLLKQYGENMAKETESDMAVPRPTCPLV